MSMPNFLIIGAAKAGTSSLYGYLKQHPQVYMSPQKEPAFFALEGEILDFRGPGDEKYNNRLITKIEDYRELFENVTTETAIGEASTDYIYSLKAPGLIRRYIPKVKLIVILRDPVHRAHSQFLDQVMERHEFLADFSDALQEEENRILDNWSSSWHYKQRGFYYVQLKRYFDLFDRNQFKIYLYDDYSTDPISVLKDIFCFLNVDENFIPDVSVRKNVSTVVAPRSKVLHNVLQYFLVKDNPFETSLKLLLPAKVKIFMRTKLANIKKSNLSRPQVDPGLRKQLIEVYRDDILKCQDLIQRDLSKWLI